MQLQSLFQKKNSGWKTFFCASEVSDFVDD